MKIAGVAAGLLSGLPRPTAAVSPQPLPFLMPILVGAVGLKPASEHRFTLQHAPPPELFTDLASIQGPQGLLKWHLNSELHSGDSLLIF